MIISLREMGQRCKQYRVDHGYFQTDVAKETGYSVENISSFETGRNDNARILLWYFSKGMDIDFLYNYLKLNSGSVYGSSVRGCDNGADI